MDRRAQGGTRVDFRYDIEDPGLPLKLLRPLFAHMGRRQLQGDFPELLKQMI